MQRSSSNPSIPQRVPSAYERAFRCLRNIVNYLRRYRDHTLVQAMQHILRPLLRRQEQELTAAQQIEEDIYQSLYQVAHSVERFQNTVQRNSERDIEVDVEIPFLVHPQTERSIVRILIPAAHRETQNREVIEIRFPDIVISPEPAEGPLDYAHLGGFYDFQQLGNDLYGRLMNRWEQLPLSVRRGEEEHLPEDFDDMVLGEGIAGATIEEIERLPLVTLSDHDTNQVCAICLEEFDSSTTIRRLPCEHSFHPDCVRSWLLRNPICPIDRRSIFEDP